MMTKMFKPRLVGLVGKARSGKDTVAKLLQQHYAIQAISFAQPLRDGLSAMLGLNDDHFHGTIKETPIPWLGKSPRQLMQTLGTEWGRNLVNQDIWLLLANQKIKWATTLGMHAIITDVRFENEATFIRENGGVVWHVIREDAPTVQAHVSEAGVAFNPLFDYKLYNNGTLEELEANALYLFEKDVYDEQ